jgi:hypothetical protein
MKISIPEIYIDGKFRPNRINSATLTELSDWLKSILLGNEAYFRIEEIESPHGYLQTIFHKLDPQTRGSVEDILIEFLQDMVFNEKTGWAGRNVDELLLLIPDIFLTSHRTTEPIRLLLLYISQRKKAEDDKEKLLWRTLQTLVRLKYRGNPAFWIDLYSNYGDEIADIVFAGLTATDLKSAFAWLTDNHTNQKAIHSLILRLPLLVKEFGIDGVQNHLLKLMCIINDDNKNRIYKISTKLGLVLYPPLLIHLAEKIELLADALNYKFPDNADSALEKVMYLDTRINKDFPIEPKKYIDLTPDLTIINAISKYIESNSRTVRGFTFSKECRVDICNYIDSISKDILIEDQEVLLFDRLVIETTGINVWNELIRISIIRSSDYHE